MTHKKKYAVFGNPIAHSFSPQIYKKLFSNNNFPASYTRILTDTPQKIIHFINVFNLSGANITFPFKQSIIPLLDSIADDAKEIQSVNTIVNQNGKLLGFNTD